MALVQGLGYPCSLPPREDGSAEVSAAAAETEAKRGLFLAGLALTAPLTVFAMVLPISSDMEVATKKVCPASPSPPPPQ